MIKLTTYWATFTSISASSRQLIGMGWGRRIWSLQLCQSLGSLGTRAISRSTRRPIGSTCPRRALRRSGCSGTFKSANGLSDQLLREMSKGGSGWQTMKKFIWTWTLIMNHDRGGTIQWSSIFWLEQWEDIRTHYFPAQRRTCAQIHFEWAAKIARSE